METINLLILEDDIETLSVLLRYIAELEDKLYPEQEIDITVFSNYKQVETLVNTQPGNMYDVVLLDRDCKLAGSFHVLDIEKIGSERIISISSTPQWNTEAQKRGISRVVFKDFFDLETFAGGVISELSEIIEETS
jgi:hypothetical protein